MGKLRGRKYKRKTSLLIVVSEECALSKAGNNLPGIDVVPVNALNTELLAPGAMAGRVVLWTEKAIDILEKEKLYI